MESEITEREDELVFSIGYAGEHFRYYSNGISIGTPESQDELSTALRGKKRIWCLITAWLPEIRPSYEDKPFTLKGRGKSNSMSM